MASLNQVVLLGNVAQEGELKQLGEDRQVIEFRLAVGRGYKSDATDFFSIEAWGKLAETVDKYAGKGRQVVVHGRLAVDEWEDANGGGKRSKVKVIARQVELLAKPRSAGDSEPAGSEEFVSATATDDDIPF